MVTNLDLKPQAGQNSTGHAATDKLENWGPDWHLQALISSCKHTAAVSALQEETADTAQVGRESHTGALRGSPEKYKHAKQQLEAFPQELLLQINLAEYAEWSLVRCCFVQIEHFIYS